MPEHLDVLIVDDSAFFTKSISNFLGEKNLKVAALNDSRKVIEFLIKNHPDLILLDIMMPELDGITLCKKIKEREDLKDLRVVIFSSKPFESDKIKAYQAGAEAFITKNASIEVVGEQIIRLLSEKIKVRFWGTRGSIPTPGPSTLKYGGNTSCVTLNLGGDYNVVFDAGSGIRELGNHLLEKEKRAKGHIFLTHFHWDHIQGLPFFAPAYLPENQFTIYGCESQETKLGKVLSGQMDSIYFPVPLRRFGAGIQFHPLDEGNYLIESFRLKTFYLNHPGNTLGYLVRHRGSLIGYLTDNEFTTNFTEKPNGNFKSQFDEYNLKIINTIQGADLVIFDAQYTQEEYQSKKGWGHSPYENVLAIAMAAKVKKCVLFHHDPSHSDEDIDSIVKDARKIIEQSGIKMECLGAAEGLEINL